MVLHLVRYHYIVAVVIIFRSFWRKYWWISQHHAKTNLSNTKELDMTVESSMFEWVVWSVPNVVVYSQTKYSLNYYE